MVQTSQKIRNRNSSPPVNQHDVPNQGLEDEFPRFHSILAMFIYFQGLSSITRGEVWLIISVALELPRTGPSKRW